MTAPRDDGVSTPDLFVGLYASRDGTVPIGNYYEPSGGGKGKNRIILLLGSVIDG